MNAMTITAESDVTDAASDLEETVALTLLYHHTSCLPVMIALIGYSSPSL